MKRVLRNSYLGLVPPRVICEVGDGGGWPTSQITRGVICMVYTVHICTYIICFSRYLSISLGILSFIFVLSASLGLARYPIVSLGISRYRFLSGERSVSISLGGARYRFLSGARPPRGRAPFTLKKACYRVISHIYVFLYF